MEVEYDFWAQIPHRNSTLLYPPVRAVGTRCPLIHGITSVS